MGYWRQLKAMALSQETHIKVQLYTLGVVILFIIGATSTAVYKLSGIENDIQKNTELIIYAQSDIDDNQDDIKDNSQEVDRVQIDVAKIFTELSSIKTMQLRMLDILEEKD